MSEQLKAWAVQFRHMSSEPWRWLCDIHGHLEAHKTREAAMHVSHQKGRTLAPRCTRVVRITALGKGKAGETSVVEATAEQQVKRKYPNAVCCDFDCGASGPLYRIESGYSNISGMRHSQEEAWRDAADRLRPKKMGPVPPKGARG